MKRVAFVLKALAGGGAERVMLYLASGFASAGTEVVLLLGRMGGELDDQVSSDIRVHNLGARRTALSVIPLARALQTIKPDAVFSALVHMNTATALAARVQRNHRPKIILTEHNQISTNKEQAHGRLVRCAYRALPWTYPLADHVVAVSTEVAEEIRHFAQLPADRISVIHNPIVHNGLSARGTQRPDHPWFLDSSLTVLLAAGSLTKQKGFNDLIAAFAQVSVDPAMRLIIIGEGPERRELQEQIDHLGLHDRVDLVGFVQNPFQYFNHAHLFVLSSLWEGFPTVLVEAMYFGTPIVATDCRSGPREITHNGSLGRLVPVGAPVELGHAITATLNEGPGKRTDLMRRARQFDIPNAVKGYQALIERLAA